MIRYKLTGERVHILDEAENGDLYCEIGHTHGFIYDKDKQLIADGGKEEIEKAIEMARAKKNEVRRLQGVS